MACKDSDTNLGLDCATWIERAGHRDCQLSASSVQSSEYLIEAVNWGPTLVELEYTVDADSSKVHFRDDAGTHTCPIKSTMRVASHKNGPGKRSVPRDCKPNASVGETGIPVDTKIEMRDYDNGQWQPWSHWGDLQIEADIV